MKSYTTTHIQQSKHLYQTKKIKTMKQETVDRIFEIVNTDIHKVLTIRTIVGLDPSNRICKVYLYDDIFLETDRKDFEEISNRYFPTLLENEEYELCHELTKIYPTIKAPISN